MMLLGPGWVENGDDTGDDNDAIAMRWRLAVVCATGRRVRALRMSSFQLVREGMDVAGWEAWARCRSLDAHSHETLYWVRL